MVQNIYLQSLFIKIFDTLKKLLKLKVKNSTLYVKIGKVVDKFN